MPRMKRTSVSTELGVAVVGLARELDALRRQRATMTTDGQARIKAMQERLDAKVADIDARIAAAEAAVVAAVTGKTGAPASTEEPAFA